MSKQIHTIQSSDKNIFDKQVNTLLEIGCELLENTYKIIENDDGVIYSQVIEYDTTNTFIFLNNHGQISLTRGLKNGKLDGLYTTWYENGQKKTEGTYKDGKEDGLLTSWYENGQKESEVTWEDGEIISRKEWDKNGNLINEKDRIDIRNEKIPEIIIAGMKRSLQLHNYSDKHIEMMSTEDLIKRSGWEKAVEESTKDLMKRLKNGKN